MQKNKDLSLTFTDIIRGCRGKPDSDFSFFIKNKFNFLLSQERFKTTCHWINPVVSLSRVSVCIMWAVFWFWSGYTDVSIMLSVIYLKIEKLLNSNNIKSKPKLFRLFWDIVVFRLVAYLFKKICLMLQLSYKI